MGRRRARVQLLAGLPHFRRTRNLLVVSAPVGYVAVGEGLPQSVNTGHRASTRAQLLTPTRLLGSSLGIAVLPPMNDVESVPLTVYSPTGKILNRTSSQLPCSSVGEQCWRLGDPFAGMKVETTREGATTVMSLTAGPVESLVWPPLRT